MKRLCSLVVAIFLTACGGGGGSSPPSSQPPIVKPDTAPFPALTIIDFYGDSTTAGFDGETNAYSTRPTSKVVSEITSAVVNNYGQSGAMADTFLPGWSERLAKSSATIIVLNFGINDATHCDANHFEWNMRPLIVEAMKTKTVVLQTSNYVAARGIVTAARVECTRQFSVVTTKLSAEYKLRLIDTYSLTTPLVNANPALLPDGVHPTEALYKTIGEDAARVLLGK